MPKEREGSLCTPSVTVPAVTEYKGEWTITFTLYVKEKEVFEIDSWPARDISVRPHDMLSTFVFFYEPSINKTIYKACPRRVSPRYWKLIRKHISEY